MAGNEGPAQADPLQAFRKAVLTHYLEHRRDLPWRNTSDPYAILVSEVMLQQTQVARVAAKYTEFLAAFPTVVALADAPLSDVLTLWQGLGYNRRALDLHEAARVIVSKHRSVVPRTVHDLLQLPGVGPSTAAAVCAFAYSVPGPFIETNIRAAVIHFFFQECASVRDSDILPLVEATLDRENPRDWFYALMDFGAWIKKVFPNPGRRSRHHTRQTPFEGSHRQVRALVLRQLLSGPPEGMSAFEIRQTAAPLLNRSLADVAVALDELTREGFLVHQGRLYRVN